MSNFRYRLRESAKILAIGENDVKNRILLACTQHFFLATPFLEDNLPKYFVDAWETIFNELSKKDWKEYGIEGNKLQATLYRMHKKTASRIAEQIWKLFIEYEEFLKGNFTISDDERAYK